MTEPSPVREQHNADVVEHLGQVHMGDPMKCVTCRTQVRERWLIDGIEEYIACTRAPEPASKFPGHNHCSCIERFRPMLERLLKGRHD